MTTKKTAQEILSQLSEEDRKILTDALKQEYEKEAIKKDREGMYALKKKSMINNISKEICLAYGFKPATKDYNDIRSRLISMTNYLFNTKFDKRKVKKIETDEQWNYMVYIMESVKQCFLSIRKDD